MQLSQVKPMKQLFRLKEQGNESILLSWSANDSFMVLDLVTQKLSYEQGNCNVNLICNCAGLKAY